MYIIVLCYRSRAILCVNPTLICHVEERQARLTHFPPRPIVAGRDEAGPNRQTKGSVLRLTWPLLVADELQGKADPDRRKGSH